MPGVRLRLDGQVFTRACRPIPYAWLDFWQADAAGVYDLQGYRLRGHQFTDLQGRYTLDTVLPGGYGGRTPHIHVKVRAPTGLLVTTQLYVPGQPLPPPDPLFRPELVVSLLLGPAGAKGVFDFVLAVD
jgi:protocatechuate 3,4-dioxygenase beta subunit